MTHVTKIVVDGAVSFGHDAAMDKGARNTMNSRKKILAAIAECDRLIAKEAARAADLRPAHVQQMVDHAVAHRAKLQAMLSA